MALISLLMLVLLCAVAALCVWLIVRGRDNQAKLQAQIAARQQVRDTARCEEIEAGLKDWLTTLQLPALEERTKLEAAARQLRTVLVEQLMRGPRVR